MIIITGIGNTVYYILLKQASFLNAFSQYENAFSQYENEFSQSENAFFTKKYIYIYNLVAKKIKINKKINK